MIMSPVAERFDGNCNHICRLKVKELSYVINIRRYLCYHHIIALECIDGVKSHDIMKNEDTLIVIHIGAYLTVYNYERKIIL